jgi:hypothetical protein
MAIRSPDERRVTLSQASRVAYGCVDSAPARLLVAAVTAAVGPLTLVLYRVPYRPFWHPVLVAAVFVASALAGECVWRAGARPRHRSTSLLIGRVVLVVLFAVLFGCAVRIAVTNTAAFPWFISPCLH